MRHTPVRARVPARMEALEGRRLLSLTTDVTVTDPTAEEDCGCHGGSGDGYDVATFHVDDDRMQCPDAEFTSIEAAVLAAPPYSTIYVCPGLYNEDVIVNKPLRLLGSSHDRSDARSADGPDPRHDSIVQFPTAIFGIFSLQASDIELDGFVIRGNASGPGVYTSPLFSGYCIEYNLITDNVFGLYLNSNRTDPLVEQSVVRRNDFNSNRRPGSANGNGIYSDQGLRSALIEDNYFTNHFSAAMVFTTSAGVNQDIVVRQNAVIDDASVVFFNSQDVLVEKNFIRRNRGSGIFLGGGNTRVTVDHNLIHQPASTGVNVTGAFGPVNVGVVVTRNLIADAGRGVAGVAANGISVNRTDGAAVKRNIILRANTDGIRLTNANSNIIADNLALHNGRDGIHVTGQSSNNDIFSNTMRRNGRFDAYDDTEGPGTAGTANYWVDNNCKTENRPGLCCNCHNDDDAVYASQEDSYSTALSAEPLVEGDVVLPVFDVPEESEVPLLPDLDVLGVVTGALTPPSATPWLDPETE